MSISQIVQDEAIDFIRTQHPFDYLNEDELEQIKQNLETVRFSAGKRILAQDDPPSRYLYVIYDGAVRLERDGEKAQVLEEGDLFGYSSILNQSAPSFGVVTEEETVVYLIPDTIFQQLIENRGFAEFFMKGLSQRLRHASGREELPLEGNLTPPVETLIVRPPIFVAPEAPVSEAAQMMRRAWIGSVLVTSEPPGIITDRDLRNRILAVGLGPDTPAERAMTQPVRTLPAKTPIYGALLFMLQENIHHLPVTRQDEIVGVISDTDLLRHQAKSPIFLLRQLEILESSQGLAKYALDVAGVVQSLYRGGVDIVQMGRVVASLNDALIRRLLVLAEEELGPPPTPYAWLVFGSEGRMEQVMLTDQDNALVYLEDTAEARTYFEKLTERVVNSLLRAGFPLCPGGYMATNWHRPLEAWVQLFKGWVETPDPQALLSSAIFFDFRPVYGSLSVKPLEQIVRKAGKRDIFLGHLARTALEFRPPLGLFRRIIRDEAGQVDLKAGGVTPVVNLARVYALEAGARSRSTFERLETAAEANTLSQEGAETLVETYRFLLRLRLREQLSAVEAGRVPDNKIRLQALSSRENRHLKDAFLAIREMQDATAYRFRTDHLG